MRSPLHGVKQIHPAQVNALPPSCTRNENHTQKKRNPASRPEHQKIHDPHSRPPFPPKIPRKKKEKNPVQKIINPPPAFHEQKPHTKNYSCVPPSRKLKNPIKVTYAISSARKIHHTSISCPSLPITLPKYQTWRNSPCPRREKKGIYQTTPVPPSSLGDGENLKSRKRRCSRKGYDDLEIWYTRFLCLPVIFWGVI